MRTVSAVHVNDLDNCVTITDSVCAGDSVSFFGGGVEKSVFATACIPAWHKMAIEPVEKGGSVFKYGAEIGVALERIETGEHVHLHNLGSKGSGDN